MLHHEAQTGTPCSTGSCLCFHHSLNQHGTPLRGQCAAAADSKACHSHAKTAKYKGFPRGNCEGGIAYVCGVERRVQGTLPSGCPQGCLDTQISTPSLYQTRHSTSQILRICGSSPQGEDAPSWTCQDHSCGRQSCTLRVSSDQALKAVIACSCANSAGKEAWSRHGASHSSMMWMGFCMRSSSKQRFRSLWASVSESTRRAIEGCVEGRILLYRSV